MKILHVISSLDATGGGPVEGLIQQCQRLVELGHNVHTVSVDAPGQVIDQRLDASSVSCVGPSVLGYGYAAGLEPWLRAHGANFDVIIIHGLWQYIGFCTRKVARALGLAYVVFPHGMLDPWFAKQYPLKHLKKWLYWPWAEYRVLRDAQRVLFTTAEELQLARQSFWLYKARESVVGFGISSRSRSRALAPDESELLKRFPNLRDKRNVLFLSRLHHKKGCDLLIRAFGRIAVTDPSLHLVMAGPDQTGWQTQLEQLAQTLGLAKRITFTGMLTGDMKWNAYDASEVFVLPSHQENFGIVVAEALASAVPVLTTYKVNIWREIQDADAGFIESDTQDGADNLLQRWLTLTEAQRADKRVRALECFNRHFEIGTVVGKLIAALQAAAEGKASRHTFKGKPFNRLEYP